ncbi:MAG: hypothetical protein ACLRSD_07300 [Oscillibacter sp.]
MTYYDYLCRLLEPMRVYRTERGTLSGGELYAAGKALDKADGAMEYAEQEGVLQTAEGEGLARREKLFSRCPVSVSTALRRRGHRGARAHQRRQLHVGCDQLDAQRLRHQGAGGGDGEKGNGQGVVSEHRGRAG